MPGFESVDMRRSDVRRETAHFRYSAIASFELGLWAMGYESWAKICALV